ncbi:MAG: hypothetical protein ACP5I4_15075 [Oceanipulchritudo sp.]
MQKRPGEFHVRARIRKDLVNLLELVGKDLEIQDWPDADYRYRLITDQREISAIMAALAWSLDYPNFKNQIAFSEDQRVKLAAFHEIWAIMAGISAAERPGRRIRSIETDGH